MDVIEKNNNKTHMKTNSDKAKDFLKTYYSELFKWA